MTGPRLVLGVDGGGSKTVAIVADEAGTVRGAGRGGNCDLYSNPYGAGGEIARAVNEALAAAGVAANDVTRGVFSLCGADWPEDFDDLSALISALGLSPRFRVVNDAVGALSAAVPEGNGVVVVCGTGAATGSRNAEGRLWHSSFWQGVQGGHELARAALDAVYRAHLGIGPETALTARLLDAAQAPGVEALLHRSTRREGHERINLNRIVPRVLDVAAEGDMTAQALVRRHAEALGDYALAAARQVGILEKPFALVLTGGLLRHNSTLFPEALIARVRAFAPHAEPRSSAVPPVTGAVLMALADLGVELEPGIALRIEDGLPAAAFFATSG